MPEAVLLDELPAEFASDDLGSDIPPGTIPCPECGEYFKSRGMTRHLVHSHGMDPPVKAASASTGKGTVKLAEQWAEFQRGASLFVSFACTQCAAVLIEDAVSDGAAIAAFCDSRPKLKKQIQQALTGMDVMLLVGALGETARKMISHHSLGRQLGLAGPTHQHATGGNPQEKMMDFLTGLEEDSRNALLNQVFNGMAKSAPQTGTPATSNGSSPAATPVVVTVDPPPPANTEPLPGEPPMPDTFYSEQDKYLMATAHTGSEFVETNGL